MVELILNNNRSFNKDIIDAIKDTPELLGLSQEVFDDLRNQVITENNNVLIINPGNLNSPNENWDIFDDKKNYIGNIILLFDEDENSWEIDLVIFNNYRNNGYAEESLRKLLNINQERTWVANILSTNPAYNGLKNILLNLDFILPDDGIRNSNGIIVHQFIRSANS